MRIATWGCELHGVIMPFIAQQFALRETVSELEVAQSIIFRLDNNLFPREWMVRGKRPLYIGSGTFVKINRGAITGLPEGRIGKMAEDLISTCDWIKIKGAVGQH